MSLIPMGRASGKPFSFKAKHFRIELGKAYEAIFLKKVGNSFIFRIQNENHSIPKAWISLQPTPFQKGQMIFKEVQNHLQADFQAHQADRHSVKDISPEQKQTPSSLNTPSTIESQMTEGEEKTSSTSTTPTFSLHVNEEQLNTNKNIAHASKKSRSHSKTTNNIYLDFSMKKLGNLSALIKSEAGKLFVDISFAQTPGEDLPKASESLKNALAKLGWESPIIRFYQKEKKMPNEHSGLINLKA